MKLIALRAALVVVLAFVAVAVAAPAVAMVPSRDEVPIVRRWQPSPRDDAGGSRQRVEPVIYWTIAGAGAGAVAFAGLYLLKRRLGGFPKNPSWVAPITIMPSRESPDEATFGDAAPGELHGGHH